jgi:hypothetical protein
MLGCGGAGSHRLTAKTSTLVAISVAWPSRSRTIGAPSSALSCVVTLDNAKPEGGDFRFVIDREPMTASFSKTYTSPVEALIGATTETVQFYSAAGGTGTLVASSSGPATLSANGTGLDAVTLDHTIKEISSGHRTLSVGTPIQLTFVAYDAENRSVAVSPGSVTWRVDSGSDLLNVSPDGIATGTAEGYPKVSASIDGISSPTTTLSVIGADGTTKFSAQMSMIGGFSDNVTRAGQTQDIRLKDANGKVTTVPKVLSPLSLDYRPPFGITKVVVIKAGSNLFTGPYFRGSAIGMIDLNGSFDASANTGGTIPLDTQGRLAQDIVMPANGVIVLPINEIGQCVFVGGVKIQLGTDFKAVHLVDFDYEFSVKPILSGPFGLQPVGTLSATQYPGARALLYLVFHNQYAENDQNVLLCQSATDGSGTLMGFWQAYESGSFPDVVVTCSYFDP